uniref:Uncharacterized protein n=1 Tax=Anopheles albimanus TaxID=7167 RepID=A0A182FWV9_ANOAL
MHTTLVGLWSRTATTPQETASCRPLWPTRCPRCSATQQPDEFSSPMLSVASCHPGPVCVGCYL